MVRKRKKASMKVKSCPTSDNFQQYKTMEYCLLACDVSVDAVDDYVG